MSRILVVEDDPVISMIVEEILLDMGHQVVVDLTLDNALLELDASEFDGVLLDMHLRGENARPIVLALIARKVPFVVLSGSDQSELVREFPQIRVIAKPFGKAKLEQTVRDLLDSKTGDGESA